MNNVIRIIIAGTRTFNDYNRLKTEMSKLLASLIKELKPSNIDEFFNSIEIVSGNAKGADALGERYAKENNLRLSLFPAAWEDYGKRAGNIRNRCMAEYASKAHKGVLLALWDGASKGTEHMIVVAHMNGLDQHVVNYSKK